MQTIDFVFLALIFLVQPLHGRWSYLRYVRAVEAGAPARRRRLYRQTMIGHWIACAVLLGFWWLLGRPLEWLGIHGETGLGFYVVAVLGSAALVGLGIAGMRAKSLDAASRQELRDGLGDLVHFLPHDDRELRTFFGVSFSAGVVEELVFRGFVLWVLIQLVPVWLAVLLSSAAFGLAHSYQGASGIARTGAIGLAFALMFVFSGSIWLPMLFHVLLDVIQGIQMRELLREPEAPDRQVSAVASTVSPP